MSARRIDALSDVRFWLLVAALACAVLGLLPLKIKHRQQMLDVLLVVDITGSMNVRDYTEEGRPQSRLDHVKAALVHSLGQMPCGSHAGLAVFSERRPFLLLEPMEICENYAPLARTIAELDWRMAWEGDSHIASGIYKAIDMAQSLDADLVFLTDGHESPPLPYSGGPVFDGKPGQVRGLLVGVGGYSLSPIPKNDEFGREEGFLREQDVPQENHLGPPPPGAELRRGYNPRNAPFGADMPHGNEHLSSVHEQYLQTLAAKTGLGYAHLGADTDLLEAIGRRAAPRYSTVARSPAPWLAALAWLALAAVYLSEPLRDAVRRLRAGRSPKSSATTASTVTEFPATRRVA